MPAHNKSGNLLNTTYILIYIYMHNGLFNKFLSFFFVQAFKIVLDSWKFRDTRDFWLLSKFRGCRYETIEAVTKVIDTLTQEDFHGAFQRLLERYKCIAAGGVYFEGGLEFHVCIINKSAHTKKVGKII